MDVQIFKIGDRVRYVSVPPGVTHSAADLVGTEGIVRDVHFFTDDGDFGYQVNSFWAFASNLEAA